MGVVDEAVCFLLLGGSDGIGAEFIDALRGESKVSHHRDARRKDAADGFEHLFASFQFDGVGTGLFHDADGGGQSLLGVALIGAKRHVDHNEGALDGTLDRRGIDNHLVEGDG